MQQTNLESVEQLHKILRYYRSHNGLGCWFRGQADADWSLLPKAGREEYFLPDDRDIGRFIDWKNKAIAYSTLPDSDLEAMAIAQHHGLATRLLDWTQNPLVATYFAVCSLSNKTGALYILECLNLHVTEDISLDVLKGVNNVSCYMPRAISPRVLNQRGMFTVHCPSNREIEVIKSRVSSDITNLVKVIIPSSLKNELLKVLDDYGINDSFLFPDLDGLSRHKNWQTSEIAKSGKTKA